MKQESIPQDYLNYWAGATSQRRSGTGQREFHTHQCAKCGVVYDCPHSDCVIEEFRNPLGCMAHEGTILPF